jgi:NADH:ubiquinone oxidoreductase subunit 3 (subunit A)
MKKLKIWICIETVLGIATFISYIATRHSTDFSGFIVAYLIIAMVLVAIPIIAIVLTNLASLNNKRLKAGTWLVLVAATIFLLLGYIF